mmetsp:Transcript_14897/g.42385  ORF Transcript_14897/g.42385 Transcript_14897/m.42385 type:complete len:266 (+) Transcript_14897:295-1092(+)
MVLKAFVQASSESRSFLSHTFSINSKARRMGPSTSRKTLPLTTLLSTRKKLFTAIFIMSFSISSAFFLLESLAITIFRFFRSSCVSSSASLRVIAFPAPDDASFPPAAFFIRAPRPNFLLFSTASLLGGGAGSLPDASVRAANQFSRSSSPAHAISNLDLPTVISRDDFFAFFLASSFVTSAPLISSDCRGAASTGDLYKCSELPTCTTHSSFFTSFTALSSHLIIKKPWLISPSPSAMVLCLIKRSASSLPPLLYLLYTFPRPS